MANNIKKCRYIKCQHRDKEIDTTQDEFVKKGNMYYHKDCYKLKSEGAWKDQKTKENLQTIKSLWIEHIDDKVIYGRLFNTLNDLMVNSKISSDYLLFTVQYCILNKLNLNYPAGIKYFVGKKEIKDAYVKSKVNRSGYSEDKIVIDAKENENSPSFTFKNSHKGLKNILNKG